jgi:large subunit ribosomal protein L6
MKKDIEQIIEIPAGFEVSAHNSDVVMKSKGKEVKRQFPESPKIILVKKDNKIMITAKKGTKRELKLINSIAAHLKNMIAGLNEDYFYKLEICNVHFPVTVKLDGNKLKIKNFLGEKIDRTCEILPNVKVVIKGNNIEVTSPDIEAAGTTAARIELATNIRNRDRRVFQDGIFIIEKPGRREEQ